MTITIALILVWLHFVSDFVMQSHKMAVNKSSSNRWLAIHVLTYSLPFLLVFGLGFALVNGVLHFVTDYFTSRRSSKQFADNKMHDFFVTIGFDQAVHATCLFVTYVLFEPKVLGWLL